MPKVLDDRGPVQNPMLDGLAGGNVLSFTENEGPSDHVGSVASYEGQASTMLTNPTSSMTGGLRSVTLEAVPTETEEYAIWNSHTGENSHSVNRSQSGIRSSTGSRVGVNQFIQFNEPSIKEEHGDMRRKVRKVLNSHEAESVLALVILFNFALIIMDTDIRAGASAQPGWLYALDTACFVVFFVELVVRLSVDAMPLKQSLRQGWNLLDFFIVFSGCLDYFMKHILNLHLEGVRALRLVRLLRVLRVLRLFSVLKELRRLIQMMGGCFKTLFWSCLLLLIVMTTWAIIAVDLINQYVQDIADAGGWPDCERCRRSFSSVFDANITFFQTVVAGDSWGYIAIPVIEKEPWTAIIFMGALMTLVFGVLNLIVAVIVDVFAENRDRDLSNRAEELAEEEKEQKRILGQIFEKIDEDKSGSLSYDELVQGAYKVSEFARWLRVMDIDASDLEQLFRIVDASGSGEICPEEFIEAMYRMKTADSRTATTFVKHIVTRMDEENRDLREQVLNNLGDINRVVEEQVMSSKAMQEKQIQAAIEIAMSKASEVALQAAMKAAGEAASNVMNTVGKSKQLAHTLNAKMDLKRTRSDLQPPGGLGMSGDLANTAWRSGSTLSIGAGVHATNFGRIGVPPPKSIGGSLSPHSSLDNMVDQTTKKESATSHSSRNVGSSAALLKCLTKINPRKPWRTSGQAMAPSNSYGLVQLPSEQSFGRSQSDGRDPFQQLQQLQQQQQQQQRSASKNTVGTTTTAPGNDAMQQGRDELTAVNC